MNKITIISDPLDSENGEILEFDGSVCDFLINHFSKWPDNARLYFEEICQSNDVTPDTDLDIEKLKTINGEFYVVIYPSYVAALVILVIGLIIAVTYKPNIPNIAQRNTSQTSPNNELASRSNSPRLNGRIPDIFGTVRSTPDLIAQVYSTFENNIEIENSIMCIGRGTYEIHDSRDGDTALSQISGTSCEVYKPTINIDTGTPYYSVGPAITGVPLNVKKCTSVNGQTLKPYNGATWVGEENVVFASTGTITQTGGPDFSSYFAYGDVVTISAASIPFVNLDDTVALVPNSPTSFVFDAVHTTIPPEWLAATTVKLTGAIFGALNLSGTYFFDHAEINTVTTQPTGVPYSALEIFLSSPDLIAPDWLSVVTNTLTVTPTAIEAEFVGDIFNLDGTYTISSLTDTYINLASVNSEWAKIPGGFSDPLSSLIAGDADVIIGPFTLNDPNSETIICNFIAGNGLYKDNGKNQFATSVTIRVTTTLVDATGTPTASPVTHDFTMTGSAVERSQIAGTLQINVGASRVKVTAQRVTPKDVAFKGQITDEVKWRDLYHAETMPAMTFGDCTVVRSLVHATTGALSAKDRKLNLLVTRQIPLRISGSSFTSTLFSTNKASEIISQICRDSKIGGRPASEVDYDNIYDTCDEIETYFGSIDHAEFCYTFDKDGMTFEDTLSSIATAIFSTIYRRGSLIKLHFERLTGDSTLLFNHRNKLPNSEIRTVQFGLDKNHDGVEFTWVSPLDDAIETLTLPALGLNKPKKIESIGVRNSAQAEAHAWRHYNKILYQNNFVEFDSIAQGELVLNGDRILIANNTKTAEQDGDVISHAGFIIGTSQKVIFESGETYTIFLQLYDGTTESFAATEVSGNEYAATLSGAPSLPLVIDDDYFSKTKYLLLLDSDPVSRAFLVLERANGSNNTSKITAVNYDDRYYSND